jgi:hypothetical protein
MDRTYVENICRQLTLAKAEAAEASRLYRRVQALEAAVQHILAEADGRPDLWTEFHQELNELREALRSDSDVEADLHQRARNAGWE